MKALKVQSEVDDPRRLREVALDRREDGRRRMVTRRSSGAGVDRSDDLRRHLARDVELRE